MSNYSKTTNFLAKDALISGDPLKVVKGSEHDTEYTNISAAIASKADASGTAITSGAINGTAIGASTPSTGAFTTLSASSGLNSTAVGNTTASTGAFTTISASGLISANAGETVAAGQTLTLTGATVAGAPTWGSTQSLNTSGNAATVTTNANLTGGVTSIGNAATVVTNANLTGPITSTGNATAITSGNTYATPTLTGTVTVTGATVSGAPTWSNSQAITLSTAAQPNVTSAGSNLVWGTGLANFGTITKRKTADQSQTANTTLSNDNDLLFSIAATEEWIATFSVDAGASIQASTGIQIAITTPSGATFDAFALLYASAGLTGTPAGGRSTTSGTAIINLAAGGGVASSNQCVELKVWILNGATPGTVNLQWAQGTSSGTALTFRKGSFLQATRVA